MGIARAAETRQVLRFYGGSDDMFSAPRPDQSMPPGTDRLPQVKHVVLLMMENHSFDNYLGTLGHGLGLPLDASGHPKPVHQDGVGMADFFRDGFSVQASKAPTQSWHATHLQYAGGTNAGFVRSVQETVPKASPDQVRSPMRYWTEQDLPFYADLARTFPLADHWFCSCLGPTFPNRRFLLAATADGLIDDLPFGMVDRPAAGTIFDLLTRNGIDWVNYHAVHHTPHLAKRLLGSAGLSAFRKLGARLGHLLPTALHRQLGNLQFTADIYPLGFFGYVNHLRGHQRFFADARNGTLPPVSLVDPDFTKTSEENPQDIKLGEQFAARVIKAVMDGPAWKDTLLIWFYDEHGGYYDSVPPPAAVEPDDKPGRSMLQYGPVVRALFKRIAPDKLAAIEAIDGDSDLRYDRLGFRVPAVIVSPYARRGAVVSDVFDHTSALRLIEDKWNLPSLTRRDAAATSPIGALDFDSPPAFETPPALAAPALGW